METQRLLLYMALGFISLILYQNWVQDYQRPAPTTQTSAIDGAPTPAVPGAVSGIPVPDQANLPVAPGSTPASSPAATVSPQASTPTISVKTDVMDVVVSTTGATIISVTLSDYPVSIDQPDVPFTLMSNEPAHYLVAESGLQIEQVAIQADGQTTSTPVASPTHKVEMSTATTSYTMEDSDRIDVPFTWSSDDGVTVTKTLSFTRGSYEVGLDYQISNASDTDRAISHYRQLRRKPGTKDEKQQFVNTYIGAVVSNPEDRYTKVDFGDMEDENLAVSATNGWVAMIQHYFATAWIPVIDEVNNAYSQYIAGENRYLIGLVSARKTVAAGTQESFSTKAYIGPKIQEKLAAAAPHLELTVDFGWLTIIAQPLFWLLKTIHSYIGNWGWAIILTTCVIKAVFYKLSEASYRSMAKMKKLQPKMLALKERYGDDRAKMGQATMEMYKKEKANPLGGCLPMIIQIPVFIALYWTLLESVELRQAPWMFHIKDLSIKDPYFILPVLMAVTMFIQQKLNPAPVDPIQAKVFQFLPLIFGVFFAMFPAGLVLYWVVNNSLSIAQQYYITRIVLGDNKPAKA